MDFTFSIRVQPHKEWFKHKNLFYFMVGLQENDDAS